MSFNPIECWKNFEDMIIGDYNVESENLIYDLLKFYEKNNNSQKLEEMKKEQKLLNVLFPSVQSHIWDWCIQNPNKPFPEWKTDDISYYKTRRNDTENPLRKARYAYAIWTLERDINDAKLAVENFMKVAEIFSEKKDLGFLQSDEMIRFLEISKKLALSLNLSPPYDAKLIFQKIFSIFEKQNSIAEHKIMVCSDLLALLTKCGNDLLNSKYSKDVDILKILQNAIIIVDNFISESKQKSNVEGEINFLKKKLELAKVVKNENLVKSIKLPIAQLLEQKAEQADKHMLHSWWLEDASKIYHELGMTEKVEEIAGKCEIDVKKAMAEGEFKQVEVFRIEVKTGEFVDRYKKRMMGKDAKDILLQITLDDYCFIPNWQRVYAQTQNDSKQHPLGNLFQRREYTETLPSRQIEDDTKKLVLDSNKIFLGYSSAGMSIFGELIKCLLENKTIGKKDIVEFLKVSINVTPDDILLIEKAICYYIDGDHIAFSHVVIPRIEQMMRAIIKKSGGSAITYDSQESGFNERLMGGLIRELESLIDEDFHKHLEVWLGTDGQNIRNKISHGWMKGGDFKEQLSEMLLYTILRLSVT